MDNHMGRSGQVHSYRMSDADSQLLIGALLGDMAGLTVHVAGDDDNPILVTECSTAVQAESVATFIATIDPGSELLDTRFMGAAGAIPA